MKPLEGTSPDVQEKLRQYYDLLLKWQAKINLISPNTVADAWERHFVDSAQIAALLPAGGQTLYDLGSGGGFPGLVLAMIKPEIEVHLVESDAKKCAFLQTVSRETKTPVIIHNARIDKVVASFEKAPDVVTARALAALNQLLDYCAPWTALNPDLTLIFPKGAQSASEIAVSREKWDFEVEEFPSVTDSAARILRVSKLRNKV